jgi:hypothetical protein
MEYIYLVDPPLVKGEKFARIKNAFDEDTAKDETINPRPYPVSITEGLFN